MPGFYRFKALLHCIILFVIQSLNTSSQDVPRLRFLVCNFELTACQVPWSMQYEAQTTILCPNLACQACKYGIGKEMLYGMVGSLNRKKKEI